MNPNKTELVMFTRKFKVSDFKLPKMDGRTLALSMETKYLGIILDSKLSWKRNVEEKMKQGINAYYACKKILERGGDYARTLYTGCTRQ